jgi:polyisoprenoid-binding protein YceI
MATDGAGAQSAGTAVTGLLRGGSLAGRWQLDPAGSRVEFAVKQFWYAITVRGWFERFEGTGEVGEDGTVTGQVIIDAVSLNTKNKRRDKHLRSADFFDVERHPTVTVTVERATLQDDTHLSVTGTLEAAGIRQPVSFTAEILAASADAVTLRANLVVDRTLFDMTWSPLGMAAKEAAAIVTARFTRVSG